MKSAPCLIIGAIIVLYLVSVPTALAVPSEGSTSREDVSSSKYLVIQRSSETEYLFDSSDAESDGIIAITLNPINIEQEIDGILPLAESYKSAHHICYKSYSIT